MKPTAHSSVRSYGYLFLFVAAVVAFVVAGSFTQRATAPSARIVIISPHQEMVRHEFSWAFADWHRSRYGVAVEIEWIDVGGTSQDKNYIIETFQQKPDGIDIDLFYGGGVDPYFDLADRGLLQPHKLPDALLAAIPRDIGGIPMYDSEYRWYGVSLASFGILYNKVLLNRLGLERPRTWEDLADPRLATWVGSGDPRMSGSVHMIYEIILQAYGWERGWAIIQQMGANARGFTRSASQAVKDVAVGEVACALAIDTYAYTMMSQAGEDILGYALPEGVTVINPDAIAILKGAPSLQYAQHFVEFCMSEPGQRLWMFRPGAPGGPRRYGLRKMGVLPSLYKVEPSWLVVSSNPFEREIGMSYDASKGGRRWGVVNDLIGTLVIDRHRELAGAWRRMAAAGIGLSEEFRAMPLTEAEALDLAARVWNPKDHKRRNEVIAEWEGFVRARLARLGDALRGARSAPPNP